LTKTWRWALSYGRPVDVGGIAGPMSRANDAMAHPARYRVVLKNDLG
jgi:hypothetical protein